MPKKKPNQEKEEELSEEQIEELRIAFSLFDVDGDGGITCKELHDIMKSFGLKPSEEEVKKMIEEVDVDGNGTVDFDEFLGMMKSRITDKISEEDILDAFKIFDHDKDGYITKEELRTVMKNLNEDLTDLELDVLWDEVDRHHTGKLGLSDFRWMMHTDPNTLSYRPQAHQDTADGILPDVIDTWKFASHHPDNKTSTVHLHGTALQEYSPNKT